MNRLLAATLVLCIVPGCTEGPERALPLTSQVEDAAWHWHPDAALVGLIGHEWPAGPEAPSFARGLRDESPLDGEPAAWTFRFWAPDSGNHDIITDARTGEILYDGAALDDWHWNETVAAAQLSVRQAVQVIRANDARLGALTPDARLSDYYLYASPIGLVWLVVTWVDDEPVSFAVMDDGGAYLGSSMDPSFPLDFVRAQTQNDNGISSSVALLGESQLTYGFELTDARHPQLKVDVHAGFDDVGPAQAGLGGLADLNLSLSGPDGTRLQASVRAQPVMMWHEGLVVLDPVPGNWTLTVRLDGEGHAAHEVYWCAQGTSARTPVSGGFSFCSITYF